MTNFTIKLQGSYADQRKQAMYANSDIEFDDVTAITSNYSHVHTATSGFHSAQFTVGAPVERCLDFFKTGLLRRVVVESNEGMVLWEGYVHRMTFAYGRTVLTKTLDQFTNRVYIRYNPKITSELTGQPTVLYVQDDDSIEDWGHWERVINGGERWTDDVFYWADTIIQNTSKRRGDINPTQQDNPASNIGPSVTFQCFGPIHLLKSVVYQTSMTQFRTYDELITDVMTLFNQVNLGFLSTDYSRIEANGARTKEQFNDMPTCHEVITGFARRGSPEGFRYVAGIYQDGVLRYERANTDYTYTLYGDSERYVTNITDPSQRIRLEFIGSEVRPWEILPNRLMTYTGHHNVPADLYIEEVQFTAPNLYQLVGGDNRRLGVLLAQAGLPNF